jgi:hypothetical protein
VENALQPVVMNKLNYLFEYSFSLGGESGKEEAVGLSCLFMYRAIVWVIYLFNLDLFDHKLKVCPKQK